MRFIFKLSLVIINITISWSLIPDIKKKYSSFFRTGNEGPYAYQPKFHALPDEDKNMVDVLTAKLKSKVFEPKKIFTDMPDEKFFDVNDKKGHYVIDPVLNVLRRSFDKTVSSESSSREEKNWKDEWKDLWVQKKIEALNMTTPRGDVVNMVAARPWGKACGDPHQHDSPWGSCTLSTECEAEYRIYRGDSFCGRTQFVCCSLQLTAYDMYNGFDISFDDSEFKTDTDELQDRNEGWKERKLRKRKRERQRRLRDRMRRKRKIRKNISKIVREIKKVLDRSYKNGTRQKKKKTKELKSYIKELKKRYKKARVAVRDVHEVELIKVDAALQTRLNQLKNMNRQFANETFRDIVVNGTISKKNARALVARYPDLADAIDITRRKGSSDLDKVWKKPDYLDYDVEYGMLYF